MLKKRQAKEQKRKNAKRGPSKKNRQKNQSIGRLKQNLKFIPHLIFEPEIMAVKPSKTPDEILAHSTSELERIEFFYDDALHKDLVEALNSMPGRLTSAGDKVAMMNARAVQYFMSEGKGPAALNHIVIGKYYLHLDPEGKEHNLTKETSIDFIADFEQKFQAEIAAMHLEGDARMQDSIEDDEAELEENKYDDSLDFDEPIIKEYSEYLEGKVEEEEAQLFADNAEVFFSDYIKEEKSLASYDQIKPRHFSFFFEHFFPENMNPTDEDKRQMAKALALFAEFLKVKGVFNDDELKGVKESLPGA